MNCYARQLGNGPALLLLHGLFGSADNLNRIATALAKSFEVHALDLPGHGRSKLCAFTDIPSMAKQLLAYIDQQNLDAIHLVGHSLGGKVAMQIANDLPQRIASLVVVDIAPITYPARHLKIFDGLHAIDLTTINTRRDADAILQNYVNELPIRQFLLKNLTRDQDTYWQWQFNLAALYQHYTALCAAPALQRTFAGNVLFIAGEHSNYINQQAKQAIEYSYPQSVIQQVANAGHWLHAEQPQVFMQLLNEFFSKTLPQ